MNSAEANRQVELFGTFLTQPEVDRRGRSLLQMLFVPCNVQVETRRYIVPSIDEAKVPKNSSSPKNFYKIEVAIMDPSAQQARRNQRCFPRFLDRIDIFNYIPVPESFPVSTRNSKIGTVIMLLLFIAYTCYDFTMFVIKNSPTITSYPVLLPDDPIQMPGVALAFIYGPTLNQTLSNSSYFNFTLQQSYVKLGSNSVSTNLTMAQCQPDWLSQLNSFYKNLSCVNPSTVHLQGVYLSSQVSYYPKIQVNLCNNVSGNCSTWSDLQLMTSGGRVFVFLEKAKTVDFLTGEINVPPIAYDLMNFFLVPHLYNRVNIVLELVTYKISPNYLTRWSETVYSVLQYSHIEYINSNVTYYNPLNVLSMMFLLKPQSTVVQLQYQTSIARFSLWGALWGILFSIFAIIFLGYNRNKFHKERPEWQNFDLKVDKLETKITTRKDEQPVQDNTKELPDISKFRK